jgi:hypothetical protein
MECLVLAAFLGNAWTAPNILRLQRSGSAAVEFENVTYEDRSSRPPVYYGGRVGRCLPGMRWLSVEGEFIHFKTYADSSRLGEPMPQFAMSHGLNFALVDVAVRVPVQRMVIALRSGVGPTIPHVETSVDGMDLDAYQIGSLGWQAAGGVEVPVWKTLFVMVEFKWTRTAETLDVPGGRVTGAFTTRHLVAGIEWRFAR